MLEEQRQPPKDVRRYAEARTRTPEGGKAVSRTLVAMADGTNALEKALRDAFPFAEFTNDVMHACGYLSACCQALGIARIRSAA